MSAAACEDSSRSFAARVARAKAIPVLDVARALSIELFRRGNQHSARCLAKGEADRNPSLKFRLEKNSWKCFSCDRRESDVIELVKVKLGVSFGEALRWLQERFTVATDPYPAPGDPIAEWARLRGLKAESVRAFGVEVGGPYLLFAMRFGPGLSVAGQQKRRADNRPVTSDGRRSVCRRGSKRALFIPTSWGHADAGSLLVICEGEADAIAAHSVGLPHSVGAPGTAWDQDVWEALKALRRDFPGEAALILDGDVPESDLLKRAALLKARPMRVPLYVSPDPGKRDLNAWLVSEGAAAVRAGLLYSRGFTPLFNNAVDDVIEAVRRTSGLQRRHVAALRAIVCDVLVKVLPAGKRKFKGLTVGPAAWVYTRGDLMKLTGESERTVRSLTAKLRAAGFWSVKPLGGRRGVLVTVYNLLAYRKVTGRQDELTEPESGSYDAGLCQSDQLEIRSDRHERKVEIAGQGNLKVI